MYYRSIEQKQPNRILISKIERGKNIVSDGKKEREEFVQQARKKKKTRTIAKRIVGLSIIWCSQSSKEQSFSIYIYIYSSGVFFSLDYSSSSSKWSVDVIINNFENLF
jgi:hypothetical protein